MVRWTTLALSCLALGGCSQPASQADALDNAAAQSDPAAAAVMRNQADEIRNAGDEANPAAPGSAAQDALQDAGNAAARNPVSSPQPQ